MRGLSEEQRAIRDGVAAVCKRFGDEYWSSCDNDARFPIEFHRAMAADGWLGVTMPEQYGGAGLGVTEAALVMHTVASHGGGDGGGLVHPHQHVRPAPDGRARHARAEGALDPAAGQGRGSGLLRRHRAGRRSRHHQHQDLRQEGGRRLPGIRAKDVDLDRAGRQQDPAADAHDRQSRTRSARPTA